MSEFSMPEFSLSSTTPPTTTTTRKTHQLSSLILSDLFLFFSFIISHPLYFSYFIFFSPYLFKLLSFLSPLFITTTLLLLALLTFSPGFVVHDHHHDQLSVSKVSFILGAFQAVVDRLRSTQDDGKEEEFRQFEELEAYKIVFEASDFDIGENPVGVLEVEAEKHCLPNTEELVRKDDQGTPLNVIEVIDDNLDANWVDESAQLIAEVKTLGGFLHQKEEFEDASCEKSRKEVKPLGISVDSNKAKEQKEQSMRGGSKALGGHKEREEEAKVCVDDVSEEFFSRANSRRLEESFWSPENGRGYDSRFMENSETFGSHLGSFGSMRREKEWRRTLACKLFEERHNVEGGAGGGEGMDLLWETYEADSIKVQAKSKTKKGKKGNKNTNGDCYYDAEEEEEEGDGQLCCLQALKFSAGKMNLGMGRPNLVKISKALKGIGWFHHVGKHGKKGYH